MVRIKKRTDPTFHAPSRSPLPGDDLEVEIRSLRSQARLVAELAREADSLKDAIQALNALGTAFTRLAHLLESQKKLAGGRSEFEQALEEVLAKINQADEERRQALRSKAQIKRSARRSKPTTRETTQPPKELHDEKPG
jgi:chromosome segregation ATPase